MNVLKGTAIGTGIAGLAVTAVVLAPSVFAQSRDSVRPRARELTVLAGRGGELGVRIADSDRGVQVEDVQADSAAQRAGIKEGDVIVEFDGERVRSSRQFARLVQETPAGRTVKATVTRDGKRQDVQVTLSENRESRVIMGDGAFFDRDALRDQLRGFADRLPEMERGLRDLPNFNYRFDFPGSMGGARLGVSVDELTRQLADYFGAKDGVLVTSVTEGSSAQRAGLKAGDVITSINGHSVHSSAELIDEVRRAESGDVTIGIVRDKKEQSLKATIEPARRTPRGRPA